MGRTAVPVVLRHNSKDHILTPRVQNPPLSAGQDTSDMVCDAPSALHFTGVVRRCRRRGGKQHVAQRSSRGGLLNLGLQLGWGVFLTVPM